MQIAKLTTEVKNLLDHSKNWRRTWLLLRISIISWSKGLFRPSVSVGKIPNTQGGIRWRWLEYQCLLEIMFLSRKFAMWFRKLALIFVIVTFRPVIVWGIKTEQLSNLPTEKIVFKFLGWKGNWKVLILQWWTTESLCPYYRRIWNKCKKLREKQKVYQYYTINGLIRLRIQESGPAKTITHMVDLQNLFPDIDIDSFCSSIFFPDICW